jgi:hypothetical protein
MSYKKFLGVNLVVLLVAYGLFRCAPYLKQLADRPGTPSWITQSEPFIGELVTALTIAVILNLGVEWFTRLRHHELEKATIDRINSEVGKDLLLRVFNENLPSNIVQQIRRHLLTPHVCKISWHAHYQLKVQPDPSDATRNIVVWTADDQYTLKNMDRREVSHSITMEAELPEELADMWHITRLEIAGKKTPIVEKRKAGSVSMCHVVKLKAGEELKVLTSQICAGPITSKEIICSMMAVEKLVLTVVHPLDLHVTATSLHPDDLSNSLNLDERKIWELDALLPGHGIELSWKPK